MARASGGYWFGKHSIKNYVVGKEETFSINYLSPFIRHPRTLCIYLYILFDRWRTDPFRPGVTTANSPSSAGELNTKYEARISKLPRVGHFKQKLHLLRESRYSYLCVCVHLSVQNVSPSLFFCCVYVSTPPPRGRDIIIYIISLVLFIVIRGNIGKTQQHVTSDEFNHQPR